MNKHILLAMVVGAALIAAGLVLGLSINVSPRIIQVENTVKEVANSALGFASGITRFTQLDVEKLSSNSNVVLQGSAQLNLATSSERVISGSFATATGTLAAIPNPFSATTSVDLVVINVTGFSTTSLQLFVATSTGSLAPVFIDKRSSRATSTSLINAAPILASTTPTLFSGVAVGTGLGFDPSTATTSATAFTSQGRIAIGPNDKILIWVEPYWDSTPDIRGVVAPNGVWAGNFNVRFVK